MNRNCFVFIIKNIVTLDQGEGLEFIFLLKLRCQKKKTRKIEMFPPIPSMKEKTFPYLYERLLLYINSLYRCIFMTNMSLSPYKNIRNKKSKQSHGFKCQAVFVFPFLRQLHTIFVTSISSEFLAY